MSLRWDKVQELLDRADVGVWHLYVPSGRSTRNDVFLRQMQAKEQDIQRGVADWAERIHPDDQAVVLDKRQRMMRGELDSFDVEYRMRHPDGHYAALRGHVAILERDSEDKPLWVGGTVVDISRERELERRLHAMFDRPFQFIGLLTPEGVLVETNRISVRESGHRIEDVLGRLFWEAPFFADSPALQQQLRDGIARAARGESIRFEMTNTNKDGHTQVVVDFTLTPLFDDDGKVVNIIPEGRDISALAQTREALRATEQRLILATEGGNIGLWDLQPRSGQMWFSPQWCSMLGFDSDELAPTQAAFHALVHADDLSMVIAAMRGDAILFGPGFDLEFRMRCKDGSWRWIHSKGRVVEHATDGEVLRIAGVHVDVTERKEAERRLAAAERLESVGQLAAGVAHEINTPVQYVNDSVYFIRDGVRELLTHIERLQAALPDGGPTPDHAVQQLQQELPPALDRVVDGLARVAEIVRSMKEFSHPDNNLMAPVDLNRAIQSTLVMAKNEFKYVADVETHFAELPPVHCFGSQINQVVLNLVVNAAHAIADCVKGTDAKGLISIRTLLDGEEAVIQISDTGGGIPEDIRHRVFEPFFTTKEVGRGTGQGLSIAHNVVVRGHGGSVSFQTELGRGTTFVVRLPVNGKAGSKLAAA